MTTIKRNLNDNNKDQNLNEEDNDDGVVRLHFRPINLNFNSPHLCTVLSVETGVKNPFQQQKDEEDREIFALTSVAE